MVVLPKTGATMKFHYLLPCFIVPGAGLLCLQGRLQDCSLSSGFEVDGPVSGSRAVARSAVRNACDLQSPDGGQVFHFYNSFKSVAMSGAGASQHDLGGATARAALNGHEPYAVPQFHVQNYSDPKLLNKLGTASMTKTKPCEFGSPNHDQSNTVQRMDPGDPPVVAGVFPCTKLKGGWFG